MMSLSAMRHPRAVVVRYPAMVRGAGGGGQAAVRLARARTQRVIKEFAARRGQHSLGVTAGQVIPSITAVMAAPRTAAVATTTVTAAANHRRARSRGVARGKVQGIAGSMRIVDAPTQAL